MGSHWPIGTGNTLSIANKLHIKLSLTLSFQNFSSTAIRHTLRVPNTFPAERRTSSTKENVDPVQLQPTKTTVSQGREKLRRTETASRLVKYIAYNLEMPRSYAGRSSSPWYSRHPFSDSGRTREDIYRRTRPFGTHRDLFRGLDYYPGSYWNNRSIMNWIPRPSGNGYRRRSRRYDYYY